jgi:WD40 repeat protein
MMDVPQIHANPILHFLIKKDGSTMISAGKDKKIKVYNWVNDKPITTLGGQGGSVNTIALSPSQDYLMSGAED